MGFWKWKELGRNVKKGEKGIRILAPIVGIRRKKDDQAKASTDPAAINKPVLVGFRSAYVFDVSQTEGAELPEMREIAGDVGENRDRLASFIEHQGIELVFTEKIATVLGMSYGGRIAILPGQSEHGCYRPQGEARVCREGDGEEGQCSGGEAIEESTMKQPRICESLPRQALFLARLSRPSSVPAPLVPDLACPPRPAPECRRDAN